MRRMLTTAALLIACAILLLGRADSQTLVFPALSTDNAFTGANTFSSGVGLGPVPYSGLASLPTTTNIIYCSDCQQTNPCSVGGTGAVATYINSVWACTSGGQKVTLEVNGTLNGSQTLLNLASGSNITVTDGGTGTVTIAALQQLSLKVNGVANGSQTLLNLAPGTNVTVADGGTGTVTIDVGANVVVGSQYKKLRCETGLGDGLNAMTSGSYLQSFCYNDSGVTWTITGVKCYTDNNGSSTLNATNGAGTGLLTGAVTCTNSFAAGAQSGTTTIASGDFIKFTFAADGTSKQSTFVVSFTQ